MAEIGRIALIGIQVLGIVISALIVGVTFLNPNQVEERLRHFAIAQVERAAEDVWSKETETPSEGSRTEKLMALSDRLGFAREALQARRKEIVPGLLALAKAETCQTNCEFWVAASSLADRTVIERIAKVRIGQETLRDFVIQRYETSVRGLLIDLRRFGLVNLVVLSLLFGLVAFRNLFNWRFTAFSVALTSYTAWAAYGYFFNQNWALSILLQDWASPGYQAAMIFFACLFFDWLFLRGKVTEIIGNLIVAALPR